MTLRSRKIPRQDVKLNLTSMMDIVFQLIIFFLLITNFTTAELPELEPPKPYDSQAVDNPKREKLIVNIIPAGSTGEPKGLKVGITEIGLGNYADLTRLIKEHRDAQEAAMEGVEVDLRADKSIHYKFVQPVMNAITRAGVGRLNLICLTPDR
ncbi:MAG: biopolymer transporter ExbD [Phycisphaerae bacterium]|nr:biopolymer transporter ExbD [Phycisphaerae bacterium]